MSSTYESYTYLQRVRTQRRQLFEQGVDQQNHHVEPREESAPSYR